MNPPTFSLFLQTCTRAGGRVRSQRLNCLSFLRRRREHERTSLPPQLILSNIMTRVVQKGQASRLSGCCYRSTWVKISCTTTTATTKKWSFLPSFDYDFTSKMHLTSNQKRSLPLLCLCSDRVLVPSLIIHHSPEGSLMMEVPSGDEWPCWPPPPPPAPPPLP